MKQNENLIANESFIAKTNIKDKDDVMEFDRRFKPAGAIAFFILLVILGLIIWFGIYFLMLARS